MKLDIPFYKSEKDIECGPTVLKMVLEFLGKKVAFKKIAKLERQLETGTVWSIGIARAAKLLGLNSKLISQSNFTFDEKLDYYEKHKGERGIIVLHEMLEEAKTLGIDIEEKNLSLEELLSFLSQDSIPIVLVDWNVLKGKPGYIGHFLVLAGYDSNNVYVHNPGIDRAAAFMPIQRDTFVKMWESKGTDKDAIVIYRNQ